MTMFSVIVISIMSPLFAVYIYLAWRDADKNKSSKQRAKEVLVDLIKLALVVAASVAISSMVFQIAIHFIIK